MDNIEGVSEMECEGTANATEMDKMKDSILDSVAKSDGFFKSQQIGESDLTFSEKRDIAGNLLEKNVPLFLQRYWKFIKLKDISYFGSSDDYEIKLYLSEIRKQNDSRAVRTQIKNRRYEAMKKLVNEGSYFSDSEMKKRNPFMFDKFIGQHLTEKERTDAYKQEHKDEGFAGFLMGQFERNVENSLFETQKGEEEACIEEQDTDEDEESEIESDNDCIVLPLDAIAPSEENMPTEHNEIQISNVNAKDVNSQKKESSSVKVTTDAFIHDENGIWISENIINVQVNVTAENENEQIEKNLEGKKNTRSDNKELRLHGKKYQGRKKDGDAYIIKERGERKLLPKSCSHKDSKSGNRSFKCDLVDENMRKMIHQKLWNFNTWEEKKVYINGLVYLRSIIRRRKSTEKDHPMKRYGYDCYLPITDGSKVRVCKDFFLATMGLKKTVFINWIRDFYEINNSKSKNSKESNITGTSEEPSNKRKSLKSDSVNRWLELIPKVPSHYFGANSSRVYVEFRSLSQMHKIYKQWCEETGSESVERKRFCLILENQKISILKPRKDERDSCIAFKEGNLKEDYNLHVQKKNEAIKANEDVISPVSDSIVTSESDQAMSYLLSYISDNNCIVLPWHAIAPSEERMPTEHNESQISNVNEDANSQKKESSSVKVTTDAFVYDVNSLYSENIDVQVNATAENENEQVDKDLQLKKNTRSDNKELRLHGKKYQVRKKDGNTYSVKEREERKLLPKPCSHKDSKSGNRSFKCHLVDENTRKMIHQKLWNFNTWEEKKVYINGLVNLRPVIKRRKSTEKDHPIKQYGYDCYAPLTDGSKVRVCKDFFLATMGLKKTVFNNWIKDFYEINNSESKTSEKSNIETVDRGKRNISQEPSNKRKLLKSDSVNRWLELIPYCRADGSQVFVEFRSLSQMHKIYKQWCEETGSESVERKRFCLILENQNISLHKPRKDQDEISSQSDSIIGYHGQPKCSSVS